MNRKQILDDVVAHAGVHAQRRALARALDAVFPATCGSHEARRSALADCIAAKEALLDLLSIELGDPAAVRGPDPGDVRVAALDPSDMARHRIQLGTEGMAQLLSQLDAWRCREYPRIARLDYRDENAGLPPFRDADHGPLELQWAADESAMNGAIRSRKFRDVAPFVDPRASRRARAKLYLAPLEVRRLSAADLRSDDEWPLIGQRGVFARRSIREDTCLGVMGGQLLDEVDLFIVKDDRYLICAGQNFINGENLMSVVNTVFVRDAEGRACGHPEHGYNVERVAFKAKASYGWEFEVSAFFSISPISPGEELRWNYRLGRVEA